MSKTVGIDKLVLDLWTKSPGLSLNNGFVAPILCKYPVLLVYCYQLLCMHIFNHISINAETTESSKAPMNNVNNNILLFNSHLIIAR